MQVDITHTYNRLSDRARVLLDKFLDANKRGFDINVTHEEKKEFWQLALDEQPLFDIAATFYWHNHRNIDAALN